ncbi:hypothetical protein [Streptomyces luteireticuli]|uniref:hypothetical protein n=1 Tax=Streptomyces luteireticuli TaxID=173858 RepID=UPI00355641DE
MNTTTPSLSEIGEQLRSVAAALNTALRHEGIAHPDDADALLSTLGALAQRQVHAFQQVSEALTRMHSEGHLSLAPQAAQSVSVEDRLRPTLDALNAASLYAQQIDNALGRAQNGLTHLTRKG